MVIFQDSASQLAIVIFFLLLSFNLSAQQKTNPTKKHLSKKALQLSNIHLQSGVDRFNAREYFTAIEDFRIALKYNPDLWIAYRFTGDAQRQLGQFDKAIVNYNEALLLKEDTLSYFGRAEANRMSEEFNIALIDYNKALDLSAQNYTFHFGRGQCFIDLERYQEAIEDFTFCIRLRPRSRPGYSKRGFAFFYLKKYKESIRDFNQYFQMGGTEAASYYYRGTSYLNLSSSNVLYTDSAIVDYKIMESLDGKGNSYAGIGAAYGIKGDSSSARKNFRLAIKNDPEDSETYYLWGRSELNFGEYKRALDLFNKQVSLVKVMDSNLYFSLAMAKLGLCELTSSLEYFAKAIELDSLNAEFYFGRIGALFRSKKVNENLLTVSDLTRVIGFSNDKKSRSMQFASRGFMKLRLEKNIEASNDIDSAMIVSPPGAVHYMLRGFIKSNNHESASSILSDYDSAIAIQYTMWQPWLLKSYFYYGQRDLNQSCHSLTKAIELGAQVTEGVKRSLCNGKGVIESKEATFDFILPELLITAVLPQRSATIDCDAIKNKSKAQQ